MTEEKKRPVGRPEKEVNPDELIPLIEEYISNLDNIERRGQSYRYVSNMLDTEHNKAVSDEYYKKFNMYLTYRKLGTYRINKNKTKALLGIVTRVCDFKDVQLIENNKKYRCIIYPGIIE